MDLVLLLIKFLSSKVNISKCGHQVKVNWCGYPKQLKQCGKLLTFILWYYLVKLNPWGDVVTQKDLGSLDK